MSVFLWKCHANYGKFTNLGRMGKNLLKKPMYTVTRECSNEANKSSTMFVPFMDYQNFRRNQAKRSILVQVQSQDSFKELHTYCSSLGTVKEMFHYSEGIDPMVISQEKLTDKENDLGIEKLIFSLECHNILYISHDDFFQHFILVEFETEANIENVLSESTHLLESQAIPTHSQFLWFRASNKKLSRLKQSKKAKLSMKNSTDFLKEESLRDSLGTTSEISEQMKQLHELTKLNEVGSRLRFLTARQIESTIIGMFPKACAYPFGSSVNGFGKMGCDLDLVLRLSDDKENENSRLVYHCKAATASDRSSSQKNMEVIGDMIHLYLPGCSQVRRILQARVPIVKYHQQLTGIECDLSMTNMSGVYMSDFLYLMGEIDDRVRPLVFTIRKWAKEVGLTNSSPGRWISNFSLTLLVLAYLQKPFNNSPVLPTLNSLYRAAGPEDKYTIEDGTNCSFLRDIRKLNFKKTNNKSLEALLLEFFEFYSQFDFSLKAVSLNDSVHLTKPDFSAMYIVNPLERGLNVSKNVSLEEVEKFKQEVRSAAWYLESDEKSDGLLTLFTKKKQPKLSFSLSKKQKRLMEIKQIFHDEEIGEQLQMKEKDPKQNDDIEFKSKQIEKAVSDIKKETQSQIKTIGLALSHNDR